MIDRTKGFFKRYHKYVAFISMAIISMVTGVYVKDVEIALSVLIAIDEITYFMFKEYREETYSNFISTFAILVGIGISFVLKYVDNPYENSYILNYLNKIIIGIFPLVVLYVSVIFIIKPIFLKIKNEHLINFIKGVLVIIFMVSSVKFYTYMIMNNISIIS